MAITPVDVDVQPEELADFGGCLRLERERAEITLEQIAARTKVSRNMLEALERNDVSRWPHGIFRRAFIRNYAEIVGLDPDRTVAVFSLAFPDQQAQVSGGKVPVAEPPALRLTFASEGLRWSAVFARVAASVTDLMAPITVALPSGLLGGTHLFWMVLAVVAVLYVALSTLVLGTTPGLWMMQRVGSQGRALRNTGLRSELALRLRRAAPVDAPPDSEGIQPVGNR
jgi:transcriptional regulator with XRE-family HTH domain